MDHIHNYSSKFDYDRHISQSSSTYMSPDCSRADKFVNYDPVAWNEIDYTNKPYDERPLTFEILTNGQVGFGCANSGDWQRTIWVRKNNTQWGQVQFGQNYSITVSSGDFLEFAGFNNTYGSSGSRNCYFTTSCNINICGNIVSLIDASNFNRLQYWPATSFSAFSSTNRFKELFGGTHVISAKNLILPILSSFSVSSSGGNYNDGTYFGLFKNCTDLIEAPKLPATTLYGSDYQEMFYGCTKLKTAPYLPATKLNAACYENMFYGCTSLENVQDVLPGQVSAQCYFQMFRGCTSLKKAPKLTCASTTVDSTSCYYQMFYGCSNLESVEIYLTSEIPQWGCYRMFYNCRKLNKVTCLITSGFSNYNAITEWMYSVSSTGDFYCAPGVTWSRGTSGIPTNWTVHTAEQVEYLEVAGTGSKYRSCDITTDFLLTNDQDVKITSIYTVPKIISNPSCMLYTFNGSECRIAKDNSYIDLYSYRYKCNAPSTKLLESIRVGYTYKYSNLVTCVYTAKDHQSGLYVLYTSTDAPESYSYSNIDSYDETNMSASTGYGSSSVAMVNSAFTIFDKHYTLVGTRFHGLKIYEGSEYSTPIFELVPARIGDLPILWDKITNKFYYNLNCSYNLP